MKRRLAILALILCLPLTMACRDIPLAELKAEYSDAQSRFITVNGMPVHYKDEGRGPTLILLHGTGASLHTWDTWTSELQDSCRVVRLDLPAFGLTGPHPEHDYSYASYCDFLHEFVTRLGLERFALAGNSLGGGIAWNYAVRHPEQVRSLILIDAAGYPIEKPFIFKLANSPLIPGRLFTTFTPRFMVRKNLEEVYGDPHKISATLIDRYHDLLLREGNREAMLHRMRQYDQNPADIKNIQVPTLIMWGADDRWIPLENGRRFQADIEDSRLIVYPGLGHVPMEEAPLRTVKDALLFLRQNSCAGPRTIIIAPKLMGPSNPPLQLPD